MGFQMRILRRCIFTLLVLDVIAQNKTRDTPFHTGESLDNGVYTKVACPPTCPMDCKELQDLGYETDSAYTIYIAGNPLSPLDVYCDMTTAGGGWLVFQKRTDGGVNFYRNWAEYELGFGSHMDEFWLGNMYLNKLLAQKHYRLRVDLTAFDGGAGYAEYPYFSIGPTASKYRLSFNCHEGYRGNAGDSLSFHNGMMFSTFDDDNDADSGNCAEGNLDGAWWYKNCAYSNLNGVYESPYFRWNTFGGISGVSPLKTSQMKFRPM